MKFNEVWLRQFANPKLDTQALAAQLTMAGLEVDAITPVAGTFTGVVVGEIVAIAPHPAADKLRVCQVSAGASPVQVVCGAANARLGLKIPFATVGALLPKNGAINAATLRGVESMGMLCAAAELGLAEQSDGLLELPADAPLGVDIREYLQLDDQVIELGLTPNRADCLSLTGLAREVAVLNQIGVEALVINPVAPQISEQFPVEVTAAAECPRYVGRVIRGIDAAREAPQWLRERLRRCGIRSISAVVDVTNYVMLELGQPMHAFDLNTLQGGIRVRLAAAGETLVTLDGQSLTLRPDTLVIADHSAPLAAAGIMGGKSSAVSDATTDLFLESAFFAPSLLAGRARSYGLHTESSHRFERGVDSQLQVRAMERATQLILDIAGGQAGPVTVVEQNLPQAPVIHLRRASILRMLGLTLADSEVMAILHGLGLALEVTAEGWRATAPSWRFDLAIEVDLIEELARVYGYNRLPVRAIRSDLPLAPKPENALDRSVLRRSLVARGYQEAITYSFVDPKLQALVDPGRAVVELRNPIASDMAAMRTTLWAGLLKTLQHNLNRQQPRVRLFEIGLRFVPSDAGLAQEPMLALAVTGRRYAESWSAGTDSVDFFDLKGDLEAILKLARVDGEVSLSVGSHLALHPGQCAQILRNGTPIGEFGALHPELQRKLDIEQPVYLLELTLAGLERGRAPKFAELSKFPEVRRDLSVLVARELPAEQVLAAVREVAGGSLRDLRLFDVYQGKGIDPQRKSLTLGLTFQHSSRTLNEDEINAAVAAVVNLLTSRFEATLRN